MAVDFQWESGHGTFATSQRALDYLIATRRLPTRRFGGRVLVPVPSFGNMRGPAIQTGSFPKPFELDVIGCGSGCQKWV